MEQEKRRSVFVTLPPRLAEQVKTAADADGRTIAAWVRLAITEKLTRVDA
jgi:hypothetical protein